MACDGPSAASAAKRSATAIAVAARASSVKAPLIPSPRATRVPPIASSPPSAPVSTLIRPPHTGTPSTSWRSATSEAPPRRRWTASTPRSAGVRTPQIGVALATNSIAATSRGAPGRGGSGAVARTSRGRPSSSSATAAR